MAAKHQVSLLVTIGDSHCHTSPTPTLLLHVAGCAFSVLPIDCHHTQAGDLLVLSSIISRLKILLSPDEIPTYPMTANRNPLNITLAANQPMDRWNQSNHARALDDGNI
ncbi:hypothetical protein PVAP13_5KG297100 [Panicum virgatum]|uniref:Uncharacterized protein n=1 Tax=Panicum virgatum TaxID=38727 RepID=A0A8T0SMU8_PANVG|nr:hypothetical protein PVAP13_5KG297100 [Panicum virgatum]